MARDITVGSLFSGAGLGDLGLTWAGFHHSWFCEIDEYARKILRLRWPGVPIYEDVRGLRGDSVDHVDVLIGGFPCQTYSSAARGRNIEAKDRKQELVRLAGELRPRVVIGENVNRRPVDHVAGELRGLGYRTAVFSLESAAIGGDHTRNRWWVVAHTDDQSELHLPLNAEVARLPGLRVGIRGWLDYARAVRASDARPDRVDRLRCLGNGQDPVATYLIGQAVMRGLRK